MAGRRGPRKFKYFPKLPKEIRAAIWKLAVPAGQNILIDYKIEGNKVWKEEWGSYCWPEATVAKYKVPAMLSTSYEARYWAKKVYSYSYGDRLGREDSAGIGIWIDHDRDVLTFATTKGLQSFFTGIAGREFGMGHYEDLGEATPLRKIRNIGFEGMVDLNKKLFTASILKVLGNTDNIFGLRKSGFFPPLYHNRLERFVDGGWDSGSAAIKLQHSKPKVYILKYKELNQLLPTFGPTIFKKDIDIVEVVEDKSTRKVSEVESE